MLLLILKNSLSKETEDSGDWHHNPSKVTDAKESAWKVQQETQERVGDLIEKAVSITGENNIVISGGYGLNCVANYYSLKDSLNLISLLTQ